LIIHAVLAADQNYGRLAIAGSISAVLSAASVLISSTTIHSAIGFLIGTSVGYGLTLLVHIILLWMQLRWLLKPPKLYSIQVKKIIDFAKWQGAAHLAGAVGNQMDRYALGIMASLQFVGQYNIAMRLQEVVHMGVLKISEVLFPHFSVTANDPLHRQAIFFLRTNWINNLVSVIAIAPLIPLAETVVTIWVSSSTAEIAAPILRTLAIAGVFGAGSSLYSYHAMAQGLSSRLAMINTLHALLLVIFTIILITIKGPLAAGEGYLFANIVRLFIVIKFIKSDFNPLMSGSTILIYSLTPLIGGLGMAGFLFKVQSHWGDTWLSLMFNYIFISFTIVISIFMFTFIFKEGRQQLIDLFNWVSKRLLYKRK
jgi:O-antigen/teichoic acid export membrane protein